MQIRDRIKELRRVPARQLRPNPKNWRTHPQEQADALRGVLAEVGIADACIAREMPDGSLMLLDGHLRTETLGGELVPVLVLDVNEEEADKILATLDPLAILAEQDDQKLYDLLNSVESQNASLQEFLKSNLDDVTQMLLEAIEKQDEATADATGGEQEQASDADEPSAVYVNFSFPLTPNQERIVRAAVRVGKEHFGVVNTGDAIAQICKQWADENEVRD
jgi:hypothetical protein